MGQIIYPQKKEIRGPWLLNHEDFESLSLVIKEIDDLLYQSWSNQIEIEVQDNNKKVSEDELKKLIKERKNQNYLDKHIKICEITSKDEIKLSDESIIGLLKDKALEKLNAKAFNITLIHGRNYENNFDLKVSNFYQGGIEYNINCYDATIKDDIQYKIDKWIDKRKPNRVLYIWSNYCDFLWFMLLIPLIFFGIKSFTKSYTTYQEKLNSEMHKLAKIGINENNRDLALELLLKSKIEYIPNNFEPKEKPYNPIWIILFGGTFFIFFASIYRPKTIIGLGKNQKKVFYYRTWIYIVLVFIPLYILLPILINMFS